MKRFHEWKMCPQMPEGSSVWFRLESCRRLVKMAIFISPAKLFRSTDEQMNYRKPNQRVTQTFRHLSRLLQRWSPKISTVCINMYFLFTYLLPYFFHF